MARADTVRPETRHRIRLGGRLVEYELVRSKAGRKMRVRVGPGGVQVVQPGTRTSTELFQFLASHERWIVQQIERARRLRSVRRALRRHAGEILYRGALTGVRVENTSSRAAGNLVREIGGKIVVSRGPGSLTPPARSLELWLRRLARDRIDAHLSAITTRLGQRPRRVYVMCQRTKWGNCSALRNLSFNWRLVLAPDYVLRYIVTHEAVHLAIPDHSAKFWLTVQSLCPDSEKAKQWLVRHQGQLNVELRRVVKESV
jgi:predicted metal-dependent hydrolase